MCRESFKDGKRLPLTDTRKHENIHLRQILRHRDGARERHILESQHPHRPMTDGDVVGILLKPAHNDELCVLHLAFDDSKGTQQGQNVLDGHDAHDRTDRDRPTVVDELGDVREPIHMHAVRNDVDLLRRTAEIGSNLPIVLE